MNLFLSDVTQTEIGSVQIAPTTCWVPSRHAHTRAHTHTHTPHTHTHIAKQFVEFVKIGPRMAVAVFL